MGVVNDVALTLQCVGTDGKTRWFVGFTNQEFLNRIRFTTKEQAYDLVKEWTERNYSAENELDAEQQNNFNIQFAMQDHTTPIRFNQVKHLLGWHYPDSR